MLEPSVAGVLRSKHTIRTFYLTFAALVVGCVVLVALTQAIPNPAIAGAIASVLSNIAASLAAIAAIYSVWLLVTPKELRASRVEQLSSKEIGDAVGALAEDVSDYWFMGRSGNYCRAATLPKLDELSRAKRRVVTIKVVVPNPSVPSNASAYATMMRSLGEDADDRTLAASVVAMAMDLAARTRANTDLRAELGLSNTLPVVRMDISAKGAVLTRDAKELPAIGCSGDSPYLDMFRSMVENELRQSRRVTWAGMPDVSQIRTAQALATAFKGMPEVDDRTLEMALDLLKKPKHRYA